MVYQPLILLETCVEYEIVDPVNFRFEPTGKEFPLNHCTSMIGYRDEQIAPFINWLEDVQIWARDECK